jgi:esterase/lipase superfamily enzyme
VPGTVIAEPKPAQETEPAFKRRGLHRDDKQTRSFDDKPQQPGPSPTGDYSVVKVYYATDRNRTGYTDPASIYGTDRSDNKLSYGSCEVSVPKDHRVGQLEAPSLVRFEFTEDPAKHVLVMSVKEQAESEFYKEIGAKFASSKEKSALIFVHGYNVKFKDAARRTAQMAYDLKFPGVPVFFSWPSQGSYLGYTVDETNIDYAKADLKKFIQSFVRTSGARQIYLVAHSMGNRGLTGALSELFRESPEVKTSIKEVILAAPDIDAAVFKRDIVPALTGPGQNLTLYASSNDWALKASKRFHGYARAGDSGDHMTVVPGMITIDASGVETSFIGHVYFAESTSIISDIFEMFSGRQKPEERSHLVPVSTPTGQYWKISDSK